MSPDQIARVRATWQLALTRPASAAALLQRHLELAAPGAVAALADAGVADPGAELLAWVDYAVDALDRIDGLVHALDVFGRSQADRRVDPGALAGARVALVRTLEDLLGPAFDPAARAAWAAGCAALAGPLARAVCGAPRAAPAAPVVLVPVAPPAALRPDAPGRGSPRAA